MNLKLLYAKFVFILVRLQGIFLYFIYTIICFFRKPETPVFKRSKDRIFIFGSSYSLNNISDDEWVNMREQGDTMSFNMFYLSDFIDVDFHILREIIVVRNFFSLKAANEIKKVNSYFESNKRYRATKFWVMIDKFSTGALLWLLFFKNKRKVFLYSNLPDRSQALPISETFDSIPHSGSTIFDCINIAYVMGYKEIVLVGIDLKDSRYFYLPYDKAHWLSISTNPSDPHPTQKHTIKNIRLWRNKLLDKGVSIIVYNNESLLSEFIPTYMKSN